MKRFVAEADRAQSTLLPECLDDFIDESKAPGLMFDLWVHSIGTNARACNEARLTLAYCCTGRQSFRRSANACSRLRRGLASAIRDLIAATS